MEQRKRKHGIIFQIAVFFLISAFVVGQLTYISERIFANRDVNSRMLLQSAQIAREVKLAVREYPAHEQLIRYWYSHPDTMEIEYDAEFGENTLTEEKCRTFSSRHPELELRYITEAQYEALSGEDQKLYAEIAYSWLITRLNEIKMSYFVDYLFCVVTEEPYDRQFFLFSAGDSSKPRSTVYGDTYPLGHTVTVSEEQQAAMRSALEGSIHASGAGRYVDYYTRLTSFDGHSVQIGLTYDMLEIQTNIRSQAVLETIISIVTQLVLSLLYLAMIFVIVLRPLKKVQKSIRDYSQTKNSQVVAEELGSLPVRNEIGELSADVVALSKELDTHVKHIRSITAEKERIGVELSLAAQIQTGMLPHTFPPFPDHPEVNVFATMHPAKEVGGDFYDYFLIDDDHMGLVIADVSGKGVPAALFMMASKIILQSVAMLGHCPAEILSLTNTAICSNNQADMFITVWFGILELSTGRLTAANAGHEYPVLKKPGGSFEVFRDRHGFIIGGMDNMEYSQYELMLEPGTKLFVYTDGIPEATNTELVAFGVERMVTALNEEQDAGPEELVLNVRRAVDCFVDKAEQFDDLTMLCVEYRGKPDAPAPATEN